MDETITIDVCRRLDNRGEGLPDDSPRALELHNRRRDALREIFSSSDAPVRVDDWGKTNDTSPHEHVDLNLIITYVGPVLTAAVIPGLKWLGEKLIEKGVEEAVTGAVKWVWGKLRKAAEAEQVMGADIKLKDGTMICVGATATVVYFPDGSSATLNHKTYRGD